MKVIESTLSGNPGNSERQATKKITVLNIYEPKFHLLYVHIYDFSTQSDLQIKSKQVLPSPGSHLAFLPQPNMTFG